MCTNCEEILSELCVRADMLGMEALTEDEQLAVERGCACFMAG